MKYNKTNRNIPMKMHVDDIVHSCLLIRRNNKHKMK